MDFFDKIVIALVIWSFLLSYGGLMTIDPFKREKSNLSSNCFKLSVVCGVIASLIWIFD